ncbi:MAG: hypothetical protein IJS32_09530 [Kiritimatiellae bacterium]|nr:hypothetical protein [Kiritimatiellia bacterium]
MNDPILKEIYEVRRKHWLEAGETREGLRAYHERFAREFREKGPDVLLRERLEARRRERAADALAGCGAMVVRESPAPRYGETGDSARKGAEGDAR